MLYDWRCPATILWKQRERTWKLLTLQSLQDSQRAEGPKFTLETKGAATGLSARISRSGGGSRVDDLTSKSED